MCFSWIARVTSIPLGPSIQRPSSVKERNVPKFLRNEYLLIYASDALSDDGDISRFRVRKIWYADAAGKVYERERHAGLLLYSDRKLKSTPASVG